MRRLLSLVILLVAAGAAPALAAVGSGYSLFGSATYVSPGHDSNRAVKLVADATTGVYSGIDYAVPAGLTINDLNTLSTDYNFTSGNCALGSPRFGIQLDAYPNKTIFVYFEPRDGSGCTTGAWTNTGNLLGPGWYVDTSQLPGGTFYDTWSAAQARYSGSTVTDIFLVSDNGPGGKQTVLIDNTNVNGTLYDYEFDNKNDCKNGGYQNFTSAPGPFKNQGQCVSYFAKQK
jgi:hypothetical protein